MAHFAKLDSNNVVVSIHIIHNSVIGDVEDGQHNNEQIGIDFLISSKVLAGINRRVITTILGKNLRRLEIHTIPQTMFL